MIARKLLIGTADLNLTGGSYEARDNNNNNNNNHDNVYGAVIMT